MQWNNKCTSVHPAVVTYINVWLESTLHSSVGKMLFTVTIYGCLQQESHMETESGGVKLLFPTHHIHLTVLQPIITFLVCCEMLWWRKTLFNVSQLQMFIKNFFSSKLVKFYSKVIEELPDTWQQVIANNCTLFLFNEVGKQKQKLFLTQC